MPLPEDAAKVLMDQQKFDAIRQRLGPALKSIFPGTKISKVSTKHEFVNDSIILALELVRDEAAQE